MIRKFTTLITVVALLAPIGANAAFWTITDTVQNGTPYTPGFGSPGGPTLGLVGWFSIGLRGGGNHNIAGSTGAAPGYACYGLTENGNTTCAEAGTPVIWDPTPVVFSGSVNDDGSFMNLSWTGQSGSEAPFGTTSWFTSTVNSGSYDANGNISGGVDAGTGYDADGFSCWNNPLNGVPAQRHLPGPDICGNGTGVTTTVPPGGPQTKASRELADPLRLFTDNMDGTITITMVSLTYSDCVNSGPVSTSCVPGIHSADIFAQWRVNAIQVVPIPAAICLFGSALGLLGWLRRKSA
jgi:hypothetical protein